MNELESFKMKEFLISIKFRFKTLIIHNNNKDFFILLLSFETSRMNSYRTYQEPPSYKFVKH